MTSPAMTSTSTAPTHRHGCRTGIALIACGRRPACDLPAGAPEAMAVTSKALPVPSVGRYAGGADRIVVVERDIGAGDRAIGNAPLVEDVLVVVVVVHQVLDGVGDRLLEGAAFDDGDAVGRNAAGLAAQLQLAAGLVHLVVSHRLVQPADVCAARLQRGVGVGLRGEAQYLDVILAGLLAVVG